MPLNLFSSRRAAIYGKRGMAASSQPLATAAGLEILRQGGNAADAAIAMAATLNVTEPTSTGLGGDMFALFYDGHSNQVTALNGSGRAPAALTLEKVRAEGLEKALPPFHPYTITVPGACAGWFDLRERHGTLPMSALLAPAIRLAQEGFPVSPVTAYFWQRGLERQLSSAVNGLELSIEGRAPKTGEFFRNPGLVRTLQTLAEGGKQAFYQGPIAEAIVAVVRLAGGVLTLEDLAAHVSTWEEPLRAAYGDFYLYECPPNGQGLVALMALQLLNGLALGEDPLSPQRLHLQVEALRLAFADARQYISDPAFHALPVSELLSPAYTELRRREINPQRAAPNPQPGSPLAASDTVYFCVADEAGNACSFINSNYMGFGTGIVPPGWGFSLQNRGHNFHLDPQHRNCLAPGKRPYNTIIPALLTRADGSLFSVFGVMGGFMQPQGHVQVGLSLLQGLDPQIALDLPRFCIEAESGALLLEEGIPWKVASQLRDMGHTIRPVSGWGRSAFGRGQVILRQENGLLCAGSDPRADGCAMTLV